MHSAHAEIPHGRCPFINAGRRLALVLQRLLPACVPARAEFYSARAPAPGPQTGSGCFHESFCFLPTCCWRYTLPGTESNGFLQGISAGPAGGVQTLLPCLGKIFRQSKNSKSKRRKRKQRSETSMRAPRPPGQRHGTCAGGSIMQAAGRPQGACKNHRRGWRL